jgi:acetyl esterase/lipase
VIGGAWREKDALEPSEGQIMGALLDRRYFLKTLAATTAASVVAETGLSDQAQPKPTTHVYKTVGSCAIKADVYTQPASSPTPVVVWIHGGALIMGNRGGIDAKLRDRLLKAGYTVVSIDYRLAPETKLAAILEDVEDACRWVRTEGPKLYHADPGKLAVMGGSAGGYLTLVTGFRVQPRPAALVSFWGYGDVAAAWYSRPDKFYRSQPLVTKEDAARAVGKETISDSTGKNNRGRFYLYCRQQGLWPREVAGIDPDKEPRAFVPLCPIRNVTARYPPTLLVHGTKDMDVPYEQSRDMAAELARQHVEHELLTVPDAGHGLFGTKPARVAEIYEHVVAFVGKHLGK